MYLCTGHALIAKNSGVTSLAELRELYRESNGKRSFVPRRTATRTRKGASERRRVGRRASDAV